MEMGVGVGGGIQAKWMQTGEGVDRCLQETREIYSRV